MYVLNVFIIEVYKKKFFRPTVSEKQTHYFTFCVILTTATFKFGKTLFPPPKVFKGFKIISVLFLIYDNFWGFIFYKQGWQSKNFGIFYYCQPVILQRFYGTDVMHRKRD